MQSVTLIVWECLQLSVGDDDALLDSQAWPGLFDFLPFIAVIMVCRSLRFPPVRA